MNESAFCAHIQATFGYGPDPGRVVPGRFIRFATRDQRNNKDGWCKLFPDGGGGVFGCWRQGVEESWQASPPNVADRAAQAMHIQKAREEAAKAEAERLARCQEESARIWGVALGAADDHPYLVEKSVLAYGLKQIGDKLLIPVRDTSGGLCGLQFVGPDGSKRFKSGGRTSGCYHLIGGVTESLFVCEGYATGATLHEQTGKGVIIAFNAGNLSAVAMAVRSLYPEAQLIIAADNDHATPGNPGLTKGREAAALIGARFIYPKFEEGENGTDFNDKFALRATANG